MRNLSQLKIENLNTDYSNTTDLNPHQTESIFGGDSESNVYKLSLGGDKYVKLDTGDKPLSNSDAYTLAVAYANYQAGNMTSYNLVDVANQFGRARHGRDSYN